MDNENTPKAQLLKLGQKLYAGLSDEKIVLASDTGATDFQTEIERVTALIEYVRNKQKSLRQSLK